MSAVIDDEVAAAEAQFRPTVVAPPPAKPTMPVGTMVEKFVALRDKVAELKKKHSAELAPYNLAMGTLEAWMLDALNESGLQSMKAPAGTFFKTTRTSASVHEWSKTLEYIQQKEAWELLEARVSKVAAEAIIQETGEPIPGVNVSRETVLNVRRS